MDDYSFSIAKRTDLTEIKAINEECLPENYSIETYEQLINSTLICRKKATDKIIGYIIMANLSTDTLDDKVLIPFSRKHKSNLVHTVVFSLAILKDYRKLGIGSKLLKLAINAHKKYPIILQVRKSNVAALSIYKKIGFQLLKEELNYYRNPTENGLTLVYLKGDNLKLQKFIPLLYS